MKIEQELEFMVLDDLTLDALVGVKEKLGVPGNANVSVRVSKGDRPWESDTSYIKISWEKEV